MKKSFKNKGLHTACEIEDIEIPGWNLRGYRVEPARLKGKQQNLWAISD
jgi:hypothetical protein